jgi:hypothetical protein
MSYPDREERDGRAAAASPARDGSEGEARTQEGNTDVR